MLVGTLDGIDPTTKCHWEKSCSQFRFSAIFLTSDALDFVVLILNYFPSQKRLCSVFCSCKKGTMHWILYLHTVCIAFCTYQKPLHNSSPLIWTLMHIFYLVSWIELDLASAYCTMGSPTIRLQVWNTRDTSKLCRYARRLRQVQPVQTAKWQLSNKENGSWSYFPSLPVLFQSEACSEHLLARAVRYWGRAPSWMVANRR